MGERENDYFGGLGELSPRDGEQSDKRLVRPGRGLCELQGRGGAEHVRGSGDVKLSSKRLVGGWGMGGASW